MGREPLDVLIVGGGPAGVAAACAAASCGRRVGLVDDNPTLGGQIWRGGDHEADSRKADRWLRKVREAGVELLLGTQVIDRPEPGVLLADSGGEARELAHRKLILATGARERFIPFPGWTLPGVVGAGGLQSLVKSGFPVQGKRVAVAGTGPLLLAVAAYLRRHGADVRLVAEQAPWGRLARFAAGLWTHPGKLLEGAGYKLRLAGVPYRTSCWPEAAEGDGKLAAVRFRAGEKTRSVPCDLLAFGFGFAANLELAALLGCRIENGAVQVDHRRETSIPGVYAAGETTGVGGVDLALVEGEIAGYAAAGEPDRAAKLGPARERGRRFARALDRAFALRDELKRLATAETVVCRCEDVTRARLAGHGSWRSAKLATRCGMGPCQGRVCGPAVELLFGWRHESVRPPVFPTALGNLVTTETQSRQADT